MLNKTIDIDYLWDLYKKGADASAKQSLILHYISLIKYTLSKMILPVNTILEENDFVNFGVLGLNESIDRFEPERGIKFESYAIRRIKGKIQDEMRKLDWMSRNARKKANEFKNISDSIQIKQDKGTSESEILKELNISPEQYRGYLIAAADAKASIPISDSSLKSISDDEGEINFVEEIADESQDFLSDMLENEKQEILSKSIENLKENKRNVLTLYYFECLNFKEIGQILGVSESRISQIHTETIKELKIKMSRYENAQ
jgi:RNA polymerase sigma factor for flagellar operon FliA